MDGVYPHSTTSALPTFDEIETDTNPGNSGRQAYDLTSKMQQQSQMQMPPQQHTNAAETQLVSGVGTLPMAQIPSPIAVSNPVIYGPYEQFAKCQRCNKQIQTRTEKVNNRKTHITALCLFYFGWFLILLGAIVVGPGYYFFLFILLIIIGVCCCLCSCLPYIMLSCKNTNHYCPYCSAYFGTYSPNFTIIKHV